MPEASNSVTVITAGCQPSKAVFHDVVVFSGNINYAPLIVDSSRRSALLLTLDRPSEESLLLGSSAYLLSVFLYHPLPIMAAVNVPGQNDHPVDFCTVAMFILGTLSEPRSFRD